MKRLLMIVLLAVMSPSNAFSSYESEIVSILRDVSSTNRMALPMSPGEAGMNLAAA